MSMPELVVALVSALAWPIVVLIIAAVFRRQVVALLDRPFHSLRVGPLEAVWDSKLAQAEADVGQSEPLAPSEGRTDAVSAQLAELAQLSPASAVIQAFTAIEVRLRTMLSDTGADPPTGGATQLARMALNHGLIQPETARAIEGAAVLRNLTAHGREADRLDESRALDYLALTDAILYSLSKPLRAQQSPSSQ
ncbi:MAG: hypothetical protein ACRCYU_01490 [Nocardioides sp.]